MIDGKLPQCRWFRWKTNYKTTTWVCAFYYETTASGQDEVQGMGFLRQLPFADDETVLYKTMPCLRNPQQEELLDQRPSWLETEPRNPDSPLLKIPSALHEQLYTVYSCGALRNGLSWGSIRLFMV